MYRIVLDYKRGMWVVQMNLWGMLWVSVRHQIDDPKGTVRVVRTFYTYADAKQWTTDKGFDEAYTEVSKREWIDAQRRGYV